MQPVRGYHVFRFAWAQSHGLISAAEFAAVTGAAGSLATVSPGSACTACPPAGKPPASCPVSKMTLAGVNEPAVPVTAANSAALIWPWDCARANRAM